MRGAIMLLEEILPGVNLENVTTEFKGIIKDDKEGGDEALSWLRTLAAFANTQGGNLYVGVEHKTHKVLALDHDTADEVVLFVHRKVKELIEPRLDYKVKDHKIPGTNPTRYVLCFEVERSRNVPVIMHTKGSLGIYVRKFGQTTLASPEQIRTFPTIALSPKLLSVGRTSASFCPHIGRATVRNSATRN